MWSTIWENLPIILIGPNEVGFANGHKLGKQSSHLCKTIQVLLSSNSSSAGNLSAQGHTDAGQPWIQVAKCWMQKYPQFADATVYGKLWTHLSVLLLLTGFAGPGWSMQGGAGGNLGRSHRCKLRSLSSASCALLPSQKYFQLCMLILNIVCTWNLPWFLDASNQNKILSVLSFVCVSSQVTCFVTVFSTVHVDFDIVCTWNPPRFLDASNQHKLVSFSLLCLLLETPCSSVCWSVTFFIPSRANAHTWQTREESNL